MGQSSQAISKKLFQNNNTAVTKQDMCIQLSAPHLVRVGLVYTRIVEISACELQEYIIYSLTAMRNPSKNAYTVNDEQEQLLYVTGPTA